MVELGTPSEFIFTDGMIQTPSLETPWRLYYSSPHFLFYFD